MARYIDYAKIPMQKNDIGAKTIGEYFENLLLTLWDEQEDFSGKRPFGNSGWEYDVYAALISAGVVDGSLDEEGCVADVTYSAANDIVCEMIKQIFARDINVPTADVAPKSEVELLKRQLEPFKEKQCFTCKHLDIGHDHVPCCYCKDYDKYIWLSADADTDIHTSDESRGCEVAREIFEEIEFDIHQLMFEREEHRAIAIEGVIAELKKKYTEN